MFLRILHSLGSVSAPVVPGTDNDHDNMQLTISQGKEIKGI